MSGYNKAQMAVALVAIALILLVWFAVEAWACHSKWGRAGMAAVSYGPIQGCMVQLPDGRWFPEGRVREIDVQKGAR